jgi:hypothetical protein
MRLGLRRRSRLDGRGERRLGGVVAKATTSTTRPRDRQSPVEHLETTSSAAELPFEPGPDITRAVHPWPSRRVSKRGDPWGRWPRQAVSVSDCSSTTPRHDARDPPTPLRAIRSRYLVWFATGPANRLPAVPAVEASKPQVSGGACLLTSGGLNARGCSWAGQRGARSDV